MKKKLLILLLVLGLVVCFTAFTASAEEEHVHCVCGGAPTGVAEHTCEDITWQPLPTDTKDLGTLAAGNYYLTADLEITANEKKIENKDVKLCLNGHNITTTQGRIVNNVKNGSWTITDCSYNAETGTWGGTVTGGNSVYGGITYTHTKGIVNIYGGNFTGCGTQNRMGGLFVIAQDGSATSTSTRAECGIMNLYNGKIYGGYSGTGGNIHVMHAGVLNVYGGQITGGQTKFISWTASGSTSYKYGQGGNIYSDSASEVNIYGGEISNGVAKDTGSLVRSTYSVGSGGNIYATGVLNIHGGSIFGGLAEHDPRTTNGAYYTSDSGTAQTAVDGRGGNIYATKTLNITGGMIYDGQANGNTGGNIFVGGTFTMSGGKIWGGVANADKDAAKSAGLVNAYDVCGGSIRVNSGTFTMTGGTIGIDAEGKPAGGTCWPSGSEAGNLYASSSSITLNLSGGEIAYGNVIGLDADGKEIHGGISKGGNIGGSGKYTYSGDIIVRDGYASSYGGNITLYNSGNTKIQGGKIYGGKAGSGGGNIVMSGSGTSVNTLTITGGEIYGGKAVNGGNIYVNVYKKLDITGAKIYDGVGTTSGGNIYMSGNSAMVIGKGAVLTGSATKQTNGANIYASGTITINISEAELTGGLTSGNGANIFVGTSVNLTISDSTINCGESTGGGAAGLYSTGTVTLTNVDFVGGKTSTAGGALRMNTSTSSLTMTGCTFDGGQSGTTGGNFYIEGTATITDCTFKNGTATTNGGNVSIGNTAVVTMTGCTFEGGHALEKGGNVYTYDKASLTMENCNLKNGLADNDAKKSAYGGNMYSIADTLTITGGTFEGGKAQHAGNLYCGSGTINVTGVTFKNGEANLLSDGSTNGNGGNLQTSSDGDSNFTGCVFEGGKGQRGGSIAVFGKTVMKDCTIGSGEAAFGGGTFFVYEHGYISLEGTTTVAGGTCKESGGTIHINSFGDKAQNNKIADTVKVYSGSAKEGSGIYLGTGNLELSGNIEVQNIWINNTKETSIIATDLTNEKVINLSANYATYVGESATDKSGCFVNNDGYFFWNAPETEGENGTIELIVYKRGNFTSTLGPDREHNIALTNVGEQIMTIPNMTSATVTYNGTVYEPDENGVITVTFPAGMPGQVYEITLNNYHTESQTFAATFAFPAGHMENPATMVIGENTATVAEGNSTGYNYTYVAEKTGTLVLTMPETGWSYVVNNLTSYAYGDMQVYVDGVNPAIIAVTEGDELQIMVNTFDAANPWTAPAGTITFTAHYADYVAQVGDVKYESLEEALAVGGTVTLLKDVTLTAKTNVYGTVTLDLAGYTLTTFDQGDNYGFVVNGDLTITGEGSVVANGVYGIGVLGTLTVEGGTFTTSADSDYMIGNWGTTTINGGTFTGVYCVLNSFSGTATVNGGTFVTAATDATGEYESWDILGTAVIYGGTFSKDVTDCCAEGLAAFDNGDGTWYIGDAVGSANNPIFLYAQQNTVENTGTTWYQGYFSGMELTVTGENFTVLYNGETLTPANGVVTTAVASANPRMPVVFAITGEGTYTANFTYPIGNMENPAELIMGENTASITEGNTQGYFFTWTAPEDGTLTITMPEGDWMYVINNMTSYQYGDTQWSDSDPIVNPTTVTVAKGDQLQIVVNSYDPANMWANPAAELVITAEFAYAPGTEANPIFLYAQQNTVENTGTTWYQGYFSGMELTVTGENFTVLYNGETLTPANGVVTTAVASANPRMPVVFAITGEGTYTANFTYPIGNMENPAELIMGENTASITEGNTQGYFFTWTAPEDGTLTITMPEGDWMYVINNMTSYQYGDTQWSDSDPIVNPATVTVAKGDQLQIVVNSYDPANMWANPAAELVITAEFAYAAGTEANPIVPEWTWNEMQTEATASVTVPAGKTYTFAAYVSGMELTVNGESYGMLNGSRWMPATFAITNEGTEDAAYELKISYPVGTQGNPAQLVLGENIASITEGNTQGYYFTYTATETGALVITMPAGDWMYVINNMTTYQYGDMQWSDSDPVVNPAVVSVTEGDVLEIMVNSYDPANMWSNPAAELVITAATSQYIAQVGEKQYVDLQTAINEADGQTVTLLQDVTLTEKLVAEGTVTLDMNWCTLTTAAVEGNYSVVVKGDLTLDGYGTYNLGGVYGIGVTGSLTVNNGYFYTEEVNDYLIGNWGTTTIYGGTYYGVYCVLNNFAGTALIDGGEFNTNDTDYSGEYEACDVFADSGVTIESGLFSKDVSEYCAEGKVCTDTGYGMYTVNFPVGTETNPVVFYDLENTVVNTGTMYYMTYSDGLTMTITGEEGYSLTIGGETIVPEGGVYTTTVTMVDFMPMTFAITGEGTFTVNFTYPVGAPENPAELVMGENKATVAEGSWGYYYTWTATENGVLTITGIEGNQFNVNNLTSYIYGDIVEGAGSYSVNVAAGDEIQVSVNTFNPEQWWNTPAGETCITASFEGEGGSEPEGPIVGEGETATLEAPILVEYTAEADGVLTVTISGNPGYKLTVLDATGETVGLPKTGKAEAVYTFDLTAGTYTVRMIGYANWDEANGVINYSISFEASQGGETEKAEYEVDYDNTLVVGDNTLTLLETAVTTIYAFEPTEEGTYTITGPEGAIVGYWGAGEWFLTDPASTSNTIEWSCTSVGQSAYIGISGVEGQFTVTVTKTGETGGQEQTEYTVYENVHTFPEGFNTLTGEETLLNVDITEAHTAVLGTDGYYHLDTATGPVLYVDLQTDAFMMNVAAAPGGANTMRGEVDGVKYDFLTAMGAYVDYDIYPLTEDLMLFIQGYGKYQGWFMTGLSPFAEINEGTANADTAWMVLCRYEEVKEPEIEKFDIDVARMLLGNALEFQFGVAKTKIPDKTGYYAVIEKIGGDGVTKYFEIPASEWGTAGQYHAISYSGLRATEMADTFYVTIYNAEGQAVSNAKQDSVRDYVDRSCATQTEHGKTMVVDMLNYGAAAQIRFDYGTDDLANAKLTDVQKGYATKTTPEMSNDLVKGTNYQATRFILESRIQVQLAFKGLTTDMYAIYTYTDFQGKAQTIRVEGTDFVMINGAPAGVELTNLVYADARNLVTVTVYNADGTVHGEAIESMESCAQRGNAEVFVELMKFADSANIYLND